VVPVRRNIFIVGWPTWSPRLQVDEEKVVWCKMVILTRAQGYYLSSLLLIFGGIPLDWSSDMICRLDDATNEKDGYFKTRWLFCHLATSDLLYPSYFRATLGYPTSQNHVERGVSTQGSTKSCIWNPHNIAWYGKCSISALRIITPITKMIESQG
jgi:hypothetical protein